MQRQRQLLHDRQAAAFEQLRAVALVKVLTVFYSIHVIHRLFIFLQDLPRYPHGGKDSSEDDYRYSSFASTVLTSFCRLFLSSAHF
jgi:hypothetical protein